MIFTERELLELLNENTAFAEIEFATYLLTHTKNQPFLMGLILSYLCKKRPKPLQILHKSV